MFGELVHTFVHLGYTTRIISLCEDMLSKRHIRLVVMTTSDIKRESGMGGESKFYVVLKFGKLFLSQSMFSVVELENFTFTE